MPKSNVVVVVAPGRSILCADNHVVKPGTVLKEGLHGITQEDIDAFLVEGRAVETVEGQLVDEREYRLRPIAAPAPVDVDLDATGREMSTRDRPGLIPPPTTGPRKRPMAKWNYDPKNLRGKSLVELNALVAGIDSSIQPFHTKEEAVAQLSADYHSGDEDEVRVT